MPSSFFSNKRRHHDIAAIGKGYLYVSNYLILSNTVLFIKNFSLNVYFRENWILTIN